MTTITIPRDLAERLLEGWLTAYGVDAEFKALQAALSAPAGPLTAEECRQIADRMELENPVYAQPERIARDLRIWASRIDGTAPAWTGPQPVVDGE